ncbi:MAG: DNA alkylation repair protein [Candidatus Hodarchaeales archaeon]|jgi:3-methyladenine DNA glycosylase AlkD
MKSVKKVLPEEIEEARAILEKNADKIQLKKFLMFIPDAQNALVVKTPVIDSIVRSIWKKQSSSSESIIELCIAFWRPDCYYEERKIAIRLLGKVVKKNPQGVMNTINRWKYDINTWDLCDQIGLHCSGECLTKYFSEYVSEIQGWSESDMEWVKRLSLASLTKLRNKQLNNNQWEEIIIILNNNWNDERYYVRKGLSWSLRELSKLNSQFIIEFLKKKIDNDELKQSHGMTFLKDSIKKLTPEQRVRIIELYKN